MKILTYPGSEDEAKAMPSLETLWRKAFIGACLVHIAIGIGEWNMSLIEEATKTGENKEGRTRMTEKTGQRA